MSELKPCFCGKIPDCLDIADTGQGSKWALAVPGCCGEWSIEFRTNYLDFKSDDCMKLAVEAWNDSPRGYLSLDDVIEVIKRFDMLARTDEIIKALQQKFGE